METRVLVLASHGYQRHSIIASLQVIPDTTIFAEEEGESIELLVEKVQPQIILIDESFYSKTLAGMLQSCRHLEPKPVVYLLRAVEGDQSEVVTKEGFDGAIVCNQPVSQFIEQVKTIILKKRPGALLKTNGDQPSYQ